ncbi:MAG: putative photosynthetic complex assembly protein PuhE [Pseudomonadota bacterium]
MTLMQYALPVLYTLFIWWFSTGVILYLVGMPRWTFKWTMVGATFFLLLSILGLYVTGKDTRVTGAYLAFTCALMVWAWQEVAFLLGYVTGARRQACPPEATGWRRTGFALQAILHHELALVVLGGAVIAATWDAPNQTGLWTFSVLWVMRLSAKLNVFLGVRNLSESFLPAHLKYIHTYFRRKAMNPLFPLSVIFGSAVAWMLWGNATADGIMAFEATSLAFAATLLSLAVLEHWFMVLPLPSEALWSWGMRSRVDAAAGK